MTDFADPKKRDTITLGWRRNEAPRPAAPMVDEYVECECDEPAAVAGKPQRKTRPMRDEAFQKRMDNWRRTVLYHVGENSGCCASWAALYVATRNRDQEWTGDRPPGSIVTVDELDGWLVEGAVRNLFFEAEVYVLRCRHVWRHPDHWIKTSMRLRNGALRALIASAENNLKKVLAKLECLDKILPNNSHAGNVPRPESKDVPVGTALTLETVEALID